MSTQYPDPPTYAVPFIEGPNGLEFNPVWLQWFMGLTAFITASGGGGGGAASHDSLAGLQGGTTGEYYHTTNTQYTELVGNKTAGYVYAGPVSGGAAAPAFRALTLASNDFVNQGTTVTLLHGDAAGNPSWSAVSLSADVTGTLGVTNGGTGITAFGTGVATALGVNVGSSGAFVTLNGALGTPSSGTLTNATGLPAAGVTGTALVAAAIGTTVQAYDADLTTWAGITPGANVGTALAVAVGTDGAFVVKGGVLGTPSSGTLTNATGLPVGGINATGTPDGTTYLRGDAVWSSVSATIPSDLYAFAAAQG